MERAYTVNEIEDYLTGQLFTTSNTDARMAISNALAQLRCPNDGIEARIERLENRYICTRKTAQVAATLMTGLAGTTVFERAASSAGFDEVCQGVGCIAVLAQSRYGSVWQDAGKREASWDASHLSAFICETYRIGAAVVTDMVGALDMLDAYEKLTDNRDKG